MGMTNQQISWELTAIDRASAVFKNVESGMHGMEAAWGRFQALTVVGIAYEGMSKVAEATREAEQASNRLAAVLRNTGATAGFTQHELDGMAESLAKSTQFDDKDIKKAEAEILIFGKIHGQTFKDALKLSTDVAAFWGTDLPSAAKDVAKALSEPETAFKLLKSAGVTLTDQQKDQIKHMGALGDLAGQQVVIMNLLTKAYRGTADAMNTGYTKSLADASKAYEELLISLGKTSGVKISTQNFYGFLTQSLKDIREIVENGDWVEKLLGIAAFAGGQRGLNLTPHAEGAGGSRSASGKIGGLPAPAPEISDAEYAAAKISRLTSAGLAGITLSAQRDAMSQELKLLDDLHHDGYVSEEKYYAERHQLIEDKLKSELTAIQAGQAAQQALYEKAKTPEELAAASLAITKLDADKDKAVRDANVKEQLVISQQRRAKEALNIELGTKEIEYINALSKAMEGQRDIRLQAATADKDYQSDLQFEADLIGKTAAEQQKMNELRKIDLKLRADLRAAAEKDPTGETASYQETVAVLEKGAAAQKAAVLDSVTYRLKLERDWVTGARSAFNDYIDYTSNAAEKSKTFFDNSFKGMQDTLTTFYETGKLGAKDFANVLRHEFASLAAKQTMAPFAKALEGTGLIGGLGKLLGFDSGPTYVTGGAGAASWTSGADLPLGAFAGGGSFTVGGSGGTDSQRVSFLATPGEKVSVQTPGQQGGGGPVFNVDMRGASFDAVERLERLVASVNGSIERRALNVMSQARLRGAT